MINGSCGGGPFKLGPLAHKACEEFEIKTAHSSGTFETPEWSIRVTPQPVYDRVSGPKTRLDLNIRPKVSETSMKVAPHGIIGQSFDGDNRAVNGKVDTYPKSGTFTTKAMAEGAIEGSASMYIVNTPFATEFAFSRFYKLAEKPRSTTHLRIDNTTRDIATETSAAST